MKIITELDKLNIREKTAVAIGKFDGIHVGHKELLSKILEKKKDGLKATVFTFDPSPEEFFVGHSVPQLFTREEKLKAFQELGVDILVMFPLNDETAATDPEEFVRRILVDELNAGFIAAGSDVSFGDKGKGDSKLLERLGKELSYELCIIDKVKIDDEEVSSTRVRNAVSDGDMDLTERLLGTKYSISGIVEHGNHLGHTIGVPTVNILPPSMKLLPPYGVYSSTVKIGKNEFKGMTNIGRKPTVSEKEKVGVETYIYDFDRDVYGEYIEVVLHSFVRPEIKFENMEQLKLQIQQDIKNAVRSF
ncbi:bifunctional riboflavin kinase/FAD synthetase [Butyrivibrio sp. M55]|jgi:riboflavin kinase/FMN adenylyltransferase|uniref:bifunctional riboflavin kinase/FAD synthetase n=1 Tax=Butyrivibrio sp. M55 TaxID=1855323 RepID=UPI0008F23FEC|nr:bifunctional riboflavin kinase/FAD synthetase [Butyrivibrio sp. M55]SFU81410.1 riboflavin kinase / FMN adenylyltransferase [Butyrivibrio sp. M55]